MSYPTFTLWTIPGIDQEGEDPRMDNGKPGPNPLPEPKRRPIPTYPVPIVVKDEESLLKAVRWDHTPVKHKNNHRKNANFISADVVYADVDSGESAGSVAARLEAAGIAGVCVSSRRHCISDKDKFHVLSPIVKTTDRLKYLEALRQYHDFLGIADPNAKDSARFLYGHDQVKVLAVSDGNPFQVKQDQNFLDDLPGTAAPPQDQGDQFLYPRTQEEFRALWGPDGSGGTGFHDFYLKLGGSLARTPDDAVQVILSRFLSWGGESPAAQKERASKFWAGIRDARRKGFDAETRPKLQEAADLEGYLKPRPLEYFVEKLRKSGDALDLPIVFDRPDGPESLFLYPGTIGIIAAPSGHGKTTLGFNVALHMAKQKKGRVFYFTYEEPEENLIPKILAAEIGKPLSRDTVRSLRGFLKAGETEFFSPGIGGADIDPGIDRLSALMADGSLTVIQSDLNAEQLGPVLEKIAPAAALIILDYVQLIDAPGDSGFERMKKVMDVLRRSGENSKARILLVGQFNRSVAHPLLMDMRSLSEGSDIEKAAAWVLGLWNCGKTNIEMMKPGEPVRKEIEKRGLHIPGNLFLRILKAREMDIMETLIRFDGNPRKVHFTSGGVVPAVEYEVDYGGEPEDNSRKKQTRKEIKY